MQIVLANQKGLNPEEPEVSSVETLASLPIITVSAFLEWYFPKHMSAACVK